MLTGFASFGGCALLTTSNTQVIHNYSTTAHRLEGGELDFLDAGPWHDPVLAAHLPGWGVVSNDWLA